MKIGTWTAEKASLRKEWTGGDGGIQGLAPRGPSGGRGFGSSPKARRQETQRCRFLKGSMNGLRPWS